MDLTPKIELAPQSEQALIDQLQWQAPNLRRLSFCKAKPKKLQGWCDSLSAFQTQETSNSLISCTEELANLDASPDLLRSLLEVITPSIENHLKLLEPSYLSQPIKLPTKAERAAYHAQYLNALLIEAHKNLLMAALQEKPKKRSPELIAQAMAQILWHHIQNNQRSQMLYFPTPPKLWAEANRLYLCATQMGLELKAIELSPQRQTSIKELYQNLLLQSCSDTHQLTQPEIATFHGLSMQAAKHMTLSNEPIPQADHLVDLASNQGPKIVIGTKSEAITQPVYIHVKDLAVAMSNPESLDWLPQNQDKQHAESTIKHLGNVWRQDPIASRKRVACNKPIKIHMGFMAVYHLFSDDHQTQEAPLDATIINESHLGFCIQIKLDESVKSCATDLMGIEWPDHKKQLGLVKWGKRTSHQVLEIGISLYANQVTCLSHKPSHQNKGDSESIGESDGYGDVSDSLDFKSFICRTHEADKPSFRLMTQDISLKSNQAFKYEMNDQDHISKIGKLINKSNRYLEFELAPQSFGGTP